jgi:hypothetical protein
MRKTTVFFILMFGLASGLALAATVRDCERLSEALSGAIAEYKSLERGVESYDFPLRRDPMKTLIDHEGNVVAPAGVRAGLVVQGVVRSGNFKKILVDNVFYSEGDAFGPYEVLEIKDTGFWAKEGGEKVFVPLYTDKSSAARRGGPAPDEGANPEA